MNQRPQIVLGVTGGIAAYKAAEIVRLLVRQEVDVHVVMTRSATEFITPLTLQTLSGHPVLLHLFESEARLDTWAGDDVPGGSPARDFRTDSSQQANIDHIDLIKGADLVVVAPATANILARAALGLADDALSTVLLAAGPRILFAPAMNHRMWHHPATAQNVATLKARGARFVEPGAGYQACGETGVGRLAEPVEIVAAINAWLGEHRDLAGRRVLVTAGRTEEPVDPVRVLTNRSSGRMGVALAEEARDRGADVTLVAGVMSVPAPSGVTVIEAHTAQAMHDAVAAHFPDADVLIGVAAVADFRPARPAPDKIRRSAAPGSIELEPTVDILREMGHRRRPEQVIVAFALETSGGVEAARKKLANKNADFIVLNNPTESGAEFGGSTNRVTILTADAAEERSLESKREAARAILSKVAARLKPPAAGR